MKGMRLLLKNIPDELDAWLTEESSKLGFDKETYARSLLFQAKNGYRVHLDSVKVAKEKAAEQIQEIVRMAPVPSNIMEMVKEPDELGEIVEKQYELTHGDYGAFGLIETPAAQVASAEMSEADLEAYVQSRIAEATANQANEDPFSTGVTPLRRAAPRRISETSGPIEQRWKG